MFITCVEECKTKTCIGNIRKMPKKKQFGDLNLPILHLKLPTNRFKFPLKHCLLKKLKVKVVLVFFFVYLILFLFLIHLGLERSTWWLRLEREGA